MRSGELCWCRGFRGIVAPRRSARLRVRSAMMIQVSRKKWQEEILLPIGGSERRSEHCSLILQGCPEVALGQNVKYLSFVWTALKKTQRCQRICHKLCGIFSQNYMTTHVSTKQIHHSFGVEFFFFLTTSSMYIQNSLLLAPFWFPPTLSGNIWLFILLKVQVCSPVSRKPFDFCCLMLER